MNGVNQRLPLGDILGHVISDVKSLGRILSWWIGMHVVPMQKNRLPSGNGLYGLALVPCFPSHLAFCMVIVCAKKALCASFLRLKGRIFLQLVAFGYDVGADPMITDTHSLQLVPASMPRIACNLVASSYHLS